MTIQTVGDEKVLEQIEKQLHKLVVFCALASWGRVPTLNEKSCW